MTIAGCVERFALGNRRYPTAQEGLGALAVRRPGLPIYIDGPPADPWGNSYQYRPAPPGIDAPRYHLTSAGPDRRLGTSDDIILPAGRRTLAGSTPPGSARPRADSNAEGEQAAP